MKVVIVDDDPISLAHLEARLNEIEKVELAGAFLDPIEGKKFILENGINMVFLDVHFPKITGLQLAEEIHRGNSDVIIVFVSAYDKYAVDAFELDTTDYILKPVQLDRLKITIERALEKRERQINTNKQSLLQVSVCNRLEIAAGNKYEFIVWRTAKAKELFLYLLQYKETVVSRETLMEVLWEGPKQDYSLLYTTIHYVRAILENYHTYFKLINTEAGYRLSVNNVKIDLIEWEKEILSLPEINQITIGAYEKVMEGNTGAYLSNYDYIWLESERYRMEELWTNIALELACYYYDNGLDKEAIQWYVRICERNPEIEEAYFSLMKIYNSREQPQLVKRYYREMLIGLEEELGIEPSSYISTWYKEWKELQELAESIK